MSYQTIDLDLDEKIIIKLENIYHEGNIFIDDGGIAVCKFSSFLVELDISTREKIDLNILFDLFEDEFEIVYGEIIEFYSAEDYLSLAEDIIKSISDKNVKNYCNRLITQMTDDSELEIMIERLNQLLEDSNLSPSEIPLPEDHCVFHTTRSLFFIRGRKSRTNPFIRRFTIAKKVLHYLNYPTNKYYVRIESISSQLKVLFHVSEGIFDEEINLIESKKILSNGGDGSVRISIPMDICKRFLDDSVESRLFIRLKGDLIEFLLCES